MGRRFEDDFDDEEDDRPRRRRRRYDDEDDDDDEDDSGLNIRRRRARPSTENALRRPASYLILLATLHVPLALYGLAFQMGVFRDPPGPDRALNIAFGVVVLRLGFWLGLITTEIAGRRLGRIAGILFQRRDLGLDLREFRSQLLEESRRSASSADIESDAIVAVGTSRKRA